MKLKKLTISKTVNLKGKWSLWHSEYDKKTKKFHVLVYEDESVEQKESAIGFDLSSSQDD